MLEQRNHERGARAARWITAAALGAIALALWDRAPTALTAANAQIPDAGRQRQDTVEELRRTNELLAGILEHLQKKPIKVVLQAADKPKDEGVRR